MDKIRILVADSCRGFQEGLCQSIGNENDLEVVAKAVDGEETIRLTKELVPDVAIINVNMPKVSGIQVAKQVIGICPTTAIIMVSTHTDESYFIASLGVGVKGFLLKHTHLSEIISAVRAVHAGDYVFHLKDVHDILGNVFREGTTKEASFRQLHPREMQVLKLTAKGMHNRDIGEALVISERTVQTHLVNIFRKLGVSSRTEAVLYALKKGWLTLDDLPWPEGR